MRVLFLHQNFPGQFKHLAPALAARGDEVVAVTLQRVPQATWRGVKLISYQPGRGSTPGIHPWLVDFETKTIRAEACFRACLMLRAEGFEPDLVIAHPGWGESLFVKEVWPRTRLAIYCEFHYAPAGGDVGFDPEFPPPDPEGDACRLRLKNVNNLLHFGIADAGLSPTHWQASTFPESFRERIVVIHDGIDTETIRPDPQVRLTLRAGGHDLVLTRDDELVTFVNRNLEPYRGYHVFMRALPALLAARPQARVLIVGGDDVSYGARPADGSRWKDIFVEEVRERIPPADWSRVHFLGHVPYQTFIPLLQLSTVHVYLTYPFVLSWSLLEAMSAGCAIVASDTTPVREVIRHDVTGRLVDFFDAPALAVQIADLLRDPATRARLGATARTLAVAQYDLRKNCLPRQLAWVDAMARDQISRQ